MKVLAKFDQIEGDQKRIDRDLRGIRSVWRLGVLLFLMYFITGLAIQMLTGAFSAERGNHSDEAAHFVSSVMIARYFGMPHAGSAMEFARLFYGHFPKVAIGHWPPFFEAIQALAFLVFGETSQTAIALQAGIASTSATLVALVLQESLGRIAAFLAGLILVFSPMFMPMLDLVMADTTVAALVTVATYSWSQLCRRPAWKWSCLFGISAACAILTKGNALGLAFLPVIYSVMLRDMRPILSPKSLLAALIVAALTIPWYLVTYQMAADGFVYHWGLDYTHRAIPYFLLSWIHGAGSIVSICYAFGVISFFSSRSTEIASVRFDVRAYIATSLSITLFAMIAPADLDSRYLIAALPAFIIVATAGAVGVLLKLQGKYRLSQMHVVAVGLLLVSVLLALKIPHPISFGAGKVWELIENEAKPNTFILVSGSVSAEGAVISTFAEKDSAEHFYLIRAQKALAVSDWMGKDYRLKFTSEDEIANWISKVHIGWIVVDEDSKYPDFPHSVLLQKAIKDNIVVATKIGEVFHTDGMVSVYETPYADSQYPITEGLKSALSPGHLDGAKNE